MPKAKKARSKPKSEDKVAPISESKPRGRSRKKQKVAPERQRSRSVDGAAPGRVESRIRIEPTPSQLTIVNSNGKTIRVPDSSEVYFNRKGVKHVRSREIQELRGYPDQVTTVTNEAFKYLDDDLQSNLRGLFHGVNNALGPGSALADPSYPLIGRRTRATAQEYDQFFKTLIPKELTPEQDDHIRVQFNGTNTIMTDASGYTEIIRFGDGRWSRTRNGIIETGILEDVDAARIAEQTKRMIDGIMRHTASGLAGMMNADRMVEPPVRSPTGIAAPQTSSDSIPPTASESCRGRGRARRLIRGRGGHRGGGDSGNPRQSGEPVEAVESEVTGPPQRRTRVTAADMSECHENEDIQG